VRRRIASAIVGVTAFVVIALSVPLAIIVQREALRTEVIDLQAIAARALTEIEVPIDAAQLASIEAEPDAPPPFTVYGTDGRLLHGDGLQTADAVVERALAGSTESSTDGAIVVATAITDADENVVGALRIAETYRQVNTRTRTAWLVILFGGAAAIGVAWLISRRLSRRLAAPIVGLADTARRLGDGGVAMSHAPTGIEELDVLGHALADSSVRVNAALVREQRFSADVSHQLRTPIAALRLKLEQADGGPLDANLVERSLADVERLEQTVDHLLAFARKDRQSDGRTVLADAIDEATARWNEQVESAGRRLRSDTAASTDVAMSGVALAQILDVLVDNALQHGSGDISVVARRITGAGAVDVADEGNLPGDAATKRLFERGVGVNHGIGLDLARSLAEADGARLVVASVAPATFSVIMIEAPEAG